ncbi:HU family DNA-binding protein [Prolixibacter sp. SD074]|uniref:HU family DNA-binding protein n=1 Tax=Prolixibacter sp. SD074 TaxID=2652391 RepID=UPI0012856527|nr:HU family DNA-binding protein [Prolixibacter sp. SD074]GET29217.1 hypothetical protein SD074_14190 [Prolixibacter sp. SD074]
MALQYKVISTIKRGQAEANERIWSPKLTGSRKINLRQVAEILTQRSTASEADVHLVLMGLVDLLPELLLDGNTVKIDEFGSFRLHAKVTTEGTPDKVTSRNIRDLRISFLPDKRIKTALKRAVFKKKRE